MFPSERSSERLLGSDYSPLPSHDKEVEVELIPPGSTRRQNIVHYAFLCLFFVSILLNGLLLYTRQPERIISSPFAQLTYCK
jgi:hypothetical protein